MKYIIPIVILLIAAYAAAENLFMLLTRHEGLGKGVKIAHVSDLHKRRFGRDNIRIISRVKKESPDFIIVSGDIISRSETSFSTAERLLSGLCEIAPVYMIFGNHEQSIPPEKLPEFLGAVSRTDAILLRNGSTEISVRERSFNIFGLEPAYTTYKKDGGYRDLDVISCSDIEGLIGKCPEGENILIAHNPLFGEAYSQWGADYTFSGHVHGGAVRLFGIGLLSPERKFFPKNSKGVYTIGNMKLLVSAGLGKLRLFDPSEIVIYEI